MSAQIEAGEHDRVNLPGTVVATPGGIGPEVTAGAPRATLCKPIAAGPVVSSIPGAGSFVCMTDEMTTAERHIRTRQTFRLLVWLVMIAAIVTFALLNRNRVSVNWGVRKATAPLFVVIAAAAVVGAIAGLVSAPRRR